MQIEKNPIQLKAMEKFHEGNAEEGRRIQREFVNTFCEAYDGKDHCSCTVDCEYHGKCRECVAIHRAHQEHLPNCLQF